jgi:ribosome maturation factor RimP
MKKRSSVSILFSPEQVWELVAQVFALAEAALEAQDARLYLLDVAFEKEAGEWYLRLYIEGRDFAVSLDDCERVSRALDPLMETLAPLRDLPYHLEVSSPGLFRPLRTSREFAFYRGRPVRVILEEPGVAKGRRKSLLTPKTLAEGALEEFDPERRTVSLRQADARAPGTADAPGVLEIPLTEGVAVLLNPDVRFPEEVWEPLGGEAEPAPDGGA